MIMGDNWMADSNALLRGTIYVNEFMLTILKYANHYALFINTQHTLKYNSTDFYIQVKNTDKIDDCVFEDILSNIMKKYLEKDGNKMWNMFTDKKGIVIELGIEGILSGNVGGICLK